MIGLLVVIVAVIPACVLFEKSLVSDRLDRVLWIYFAAEIVFTLILWRLSTGGWFNYAIPAVVIGCILTGRALARGFDNAPSWRPLVPAVLAVVAVPVFALTDLNQVRSRRAAEKLATARLLEQFPRQPPRSFSSTFRRESPPRADRPGLRSLALPGIRVDRPC